MERLKAALLVAEAKSEAIQLESERNLRKMRSEIAALSGKPVRTLK